MRRKICLFISIVMVLSMLMVPAFAAVPVTPLDPDLVMYANDFTVGNIVAVNMDPYLPLSQVARLNPTNALGPFDAVAPDGVSDYFFATGAREWSHFTFEDKFMNVDGAPDIEFAEVTWGTGGTWHTEAVLVYLTGAYIKDSSGNVVPYGATDDGIGYYAGIAWNRIGLTYVDEAIRLSTTQSYFAGMRDFADNEFREGDTLLGESSYQTFSLFHLPDEVVYAEGIYLIDITKDVYKLADPATYLDVSGTGALVTLNSSAWDVINDNKITESDVIATLGTNGNTDGYDLDAIRVYKYTPPPTYGFCGYKLDADTGLGLEGWTIVLKNAQGNIIDRIRTDADGRYCFSGLPAGTYTVEEVGLDGWEQVFPTGGSHTVTLPEEPMIYGIERTANRPILQIDPMTGDVQHIFDTDINSFSMNGPNGLAFDSGSSTFYYVTYPYNTEYGNATLFRYVIGEASAEELYTLDHEIACADFYDGKYYYIAGGPKGATDDLYEVVFDGDGEVLEVNEFPGITGTLNYNWTFSGDIAISHDGVIYGVGRIASGQFQFFSVERDGTNFKLIDASIGMPLQLAFSRDGVLFGNNLSNNSFYTVDLVNGDTVLTATSKSVAAFNDMASGIQYYNFVNKEIELYEIEGYKYLSGTDKGLEGWLITLEKWIDGEFEEVATTTTDEIGYYKFAGLLEGDYRVSETLKPGWTQVDPTENEGKHLVTLPYEGDLESFDFHNLPELTCSDETVWAADGAPGINRFVEKGNWGTYVEYTMGTGSLNTPITYPLYAGQTHLAGMIEVYDEGGSIFVHYMIFGDDDEYKEGYCGEWTALTEYHLQVVDEFDGFNPYRTFNKRTGYGNPIPGQFDLKMTWSKDEAVSDTDWIQVDGDFSDTVYIAAHGVAWWCGYECEPYEVAETLGMSLLSR